jgi:membrane-bound metal-dependent hydrolase YbcI (DUF457 family)
MASPIGHALAGLAVAWTADLVPGSGTRRTVPAHASWYDQAGDGLTAACVLLAAAPDLDLFFGRFHRTMTHSVLAVVVVAGVAAFAAARLRLPVRRVAFMCAGAWASHLLVDWLAVDQSIPRGIQLLWPFDGRWFISGWDIFLGSERRDLFSAATMRRNIAAVVQEIAIFAPIVIALWLVRVKTLTRLATELAGSDHPPQ